MELIERYIYAVTKRLPQKHREDIKTELRGLIEDMLSERCAGRTPTEDDIAAVLTELGEPSELADKYNDNKNYLIGPTLFDTYILVLKIVLAVTLFGVLVGKSIETFVNPPANFGLVLGSVLAAVVMGLFQGFTWVTVIFAINEKLGNRFTIDKKQKQWSVKDLPPLSDKKAEIKKSEAIVGLVFAVIFIILLNLMNSPSAYLYLNGENYITIFPLFSPAGIAANMPYIIILLAIGVLRDCMKLIVGRWTFTLGVTFAIFSVISLLLSVKIFSNPAMWNFEFINSVSGVDFNTLTFNITRGFVYFLIVVMSIDAISSLVKGIKYSK